MRIGHVLPPGDWQTTVDTARRWAAAGRTSQWLLHSPDPVVGTAALGVLVDGVRFGVLNSAVADRSPVLAAKQLVTLDHLLKGRLDLGVDDAEKSLRLTEALSGPYEPGPHQSGGIPMYDVRRSRSDANTVEMVGPALRSP